MGRKLTTEEFIEKAKEIHGNLYDYSKVNYIDSRTKVEIICPEHGVFYMQPCNHTNLKQGCPKCGHIKRAQTQTLSLDKFIEKARKVHGDKYDYSKVIYQKSSKKIIIICPEHGEFEQIANDHLQGKGCPYCSKKLNALKRSSNTEEFIKRARKIHEDKYNYDKVVYINVHSKVIITCPIHGDFELEANSHLHGIGCPYCGGTKKKNTEEFIKKAINIHGNKYNYSKVEYKGVEEKVCIICPIHGEFWQTPHSHLNNHGCPICASSIGEKLVKTILDKYKINYKELYKITIDKTINPSGFAYIDFYLPDHNIFIEYNGELHYIPVEYFGGELLFNKLKNRDEFIRNYSDVTNMKLLEISYIFKTEESILKYLNENAPEIFII